MAYNFYQPDTYIDPITGQPITSPPATASPNPLMNTMNTNRVDYVEPIPTVKPSETLAASMQTQKPGARTSPDVTTPATKPPAKTGGASAASWAGAAGNVVGDVAALSANNSRYNSAQSGKTIVGGVGTVVGGIFGMPELGGQIGSFIGGTIGGAIDKKAMRADYDATTNKHFNELKLQPNINPYGSYMEKGGAVPSTTLAYGDSMLDSFLAKMEKQGTDSFQDVDMDDPVSAAFARCGIYMKSKRYAGGGVTGGPGDPKPIYTTNRNDPRLRMYNDSLLLHNQGNKAAKDLNKRMFSNAISNTEYLQWYDQNNNPAVEAAAARLTKANKQKPQPSGTTTPVDVYKNSSVIGQAATNLYTKPVQPVIYQPSDGLTLYNKEKAIYEKSTGLSYDKLLASKRSNVPGGPAYGYTLEGAPLYGYKKPVATTPKPRRRIAAANLIDQAVEVTPQMMNRRSPNVDVNKPIVTNYSYAYRTPEGGQSVQYFPDHASWQEFMKDKTYTSQTVSADKSRASASGYAKGGVVNNQNEPIMEDVAFMKKGGKNWIKGAVNPAHKGYCTPMTKSTCTPRRKAFARTMKKHHGFHEEGGVTMRNPIEDLMYEDMPNTNYMQGGGETAMAEASAAPAPQGQQQEGPQKTLINIEKGEILIDPMLPDLPVIREYENPNRYMPHKTDPMKEPIGNFTMVEEGKVVIPKKYAGRYKRGDILTRKSIVGEILKDQMNNPEQNDPRGTTEAKYAQAGVVNFNPPGRERKGRLQQWDWINQLPQNVVTSDIQPRYPLASIEDPAANTGAKFGDPSANTPVDYSGYDDNLATSKVKFNPPATTPAAGAKKTNRNWNLIGAKFASALPTAFGITNALGYDPYLKYDENYGYQDALAMAEGMETNPSNVAAVAAMNQRSAEFNQQLNNINSPSVRSESGKIKADLIRASGEMAQNNTNLAMELREKKRGTIMNLKVAQGQNRLDMRQQLMNELRMDDANRQSLVHQGISEGATNYQQSVMDEERIKAINTIATYYKLDPYNAELLLDQQLFMPHVTESLSYLSGTPGRRAVQASTATKKAAKSTGQ
jgi:hypothetical protein